MDSLARKLYELVFVDGSGITCLSRTMLHTLLERHIYARWADYGTFHGITEYSMVCVSSACADKEDYIARNPFLTQYIELVMLALAQRASLIAFDRQISHVSVKIKNVRKLMKPCVFSKRINEQELMEAFIRFKSQLQFPEVTPQQQGIELYDMLLENLYVNKEKDQVESQITSLFDYKNFCTNKRENCFMVLVSIAGLLCVADVLLHWFDVL